MTAVKCLLLRVENRNSLTIKDNIFDSIKVQVRVVGF